MILFVCLIFNSFTGTIIIRADLSCSELCELFYHWWFSGRILACHAGGPGSIPGQCMPFSFLSPLLNLHFKLRYV